MAQTTSRTKTGNRSKMLIPARFASLGATAGWTIPATNDNGIVQCPASQTSATLVLPVVGLNVGDIIVGACMKGGTASAAAKTLAWGLWKATGASGAITATLVQAMTSDTTATAHAVSVETLLTTAEKVAVNTEYFFLLTTTTAATVTFDLIGIEIYVKQTTGQES